MATAKCEKCEKERDTTFDFRWDDEGKRLTICLSCEEKIAEGELKKERRKPLKPKVNFENLFKSSPDTAEKTPI